MGSRRRWREPARVGHLDHRLPPVSPQTCGKIERFRQTLKRWLNTQSAPATVDDLNGMLDRFRIHYNHTRPHRALH
ncbi:integrase core domain-containing protein, partial [Streptomyces sp. NPDC127020]|uniref:integrase core domain-containing protein n=1 Tax=Streptomyces sp. NPDC127020 TaxID=3347109 RepID=UPI003653A684